MVLPAALLPSFLQLVFVITIRVVDRVVAVVDTLRRDAFLHVKRIRSTSVSDCTIVPAAIDLVLFLEITRLTEPLDLFVILGTLISRRQACIIILIVAVIFHVAASADVVAGPRPLNAEVVADRLADVDVHLRCPIREKFDALRLEG